MENAIDGAQNSVWKLSVGTTTFGPFWINFYVKSEEDALSAILRIQIMITIIRI